MSKELTKQMEYEETRRGMKVELTKEQMRVLIKHTLQDISYSFGGTYYKNDHNDEVPDLKEIKTAQSAVDKLQLAYNN